MFSTETSRNSLTVKQIWKESAERRDDSRSGGCHLTSQSMFDGWDMDTLFHIQRSDLPEPSSFCDLCRSVLTCARRDESTPPGLWGRSEAVWFHHTSSTRSGKFPCIPSGRICYLERECNHVRQTAQQLIVCSERECPEKGPKFTWTWAVSTDLLLMTLELWRMFSSCDWSISFTVRSSSWYAFRARCILEGAHDMQSGTNTQPGRFTQNPNEPPTCATRKWPLCGLWGSSHSSWWCCAQ